MFKHLKIMSLGILVSTGLAYSQESPMKVEIFEAQSIKKNKNSKKGLIIKPSSNYNRNDLVRVASNHVGLRSYHLGVRRSGWCMDGLKVFLRKANYKTVSGSRAIDALKLGPRTSVGVGNVAVVREKRSLHVGVIQEFGPTHITLISANYTNAVGVGDYSRNRIVAVIEPVKNGD